MGKIQTVTLEHDEGDLIATKAGQGEPWRIGAPWTDEMFYGTAREVRKRMIEIVKDHA